MQIDYVFMQPIQHIDTSTYAKEKAVCFFFQLHSQTVNLGNTQTGNVGNTHINLGNIESTY